MAFGISSDAIAPRPQKIPATSAALFVPSVIAWKKTEVIAVDIGPGG